MARRPFLIALIVALVGFGLSGTLLAQMESGDRGILPVDSTGTLEVTGIHVDVSGPDAQSARFAGWRQAQRDGFKKLWAQTHGRPISQAPDLPDSTLDGMVSSIVIEQEQIGPNRYIANLGLLFDRARAAGLLGLGVEGRRSVPMLLIPVIVTAGAETTVELRNPWQRAWAELRTSQSSIDYVRISGLGVDPLLVNAAQTQRPGRGWWRNIVDLYGAADLLVAEVLLHRAYPGGPAVARFIGYHGPDREMIGGFTLAARSGEAVPQMMSEGVRRMDALFSAALAAGRLVRDPTLDIPEPPPIPVEEVEEEQQQRQQREQQDARQTWVYQVQIVAPNVQVYNFAMAHLRTIGGVEQVSPIAINPTGTSYVHVTFRGDLGTLRSALAARGWIVQQNGYILRVSSAGQAPPPPPAQQPPSQPAPQPTPQPTPQAGPTGGAAAARPAQ
jgi:hypothetical protein